MRQHHMKFLPSAGVSALVRKINQFDTVECCRDIHNASISSIYVRSCVGVESDPLPLRSQGPAARSLFQAALEGGTPAS